MAYRLQGDGRQIVTTAGTRVQLGTDTNCGYILVQAEKDNTGEVVVGDDTVVAAIATRRGYSLAAGESTPVFADNLSDVWLDSTVNGDGVTFIYFTG